MQARKELSKSMTPQPEKRNKAGSKMVVFYGKNYRRDGELTDIANKIFDTLRKK